MFKKLILAIMLIAAITGCGDSDSDSGSSSGSKLGCDILMTDIELDERLLDTSYTINNAVKCNGSSNAQVTFSGDNAQYFLVNGESSLSYNLNNGVNQGNSLNLTFSTSPEAETIQGTISATITLKVSNYSTMEKFTHDYTITRVK